MARPQRPPDVILPQPLPLFVYGTLRAPELVAAVLGHPAEGVPATALGRRVVFYPGRTYPALIAGDGEAEGCLLTALSEADMTTLDVFEGDEYVRRPLEVIAGGSARDAQVYSPLAVIAPDAPAWRYDDWRARHAPDVGAGENAAALRARLIAEGSGS